MPAAGEEAGARSGLRWLLRRRSAIAAAPDAPGGHGSLALVHLLRGETAEARRRLERVLELDPGHAAAQTLLRDLDARVPPG